LGIFWKERVTNEEVRVRTRQRSRHIEDKTYSVTEDSITSLDMHTNGTPAIGIALGCFGV